MNGSTNIAGVILVTIALLSCEQQKNPVEHENQEPVNEPIIIEDFWSPLANSPGDKIWAMSESSEGVLYAGVITGLVRSPDHGMPWENIYLFTPNVIYIAPTDGMILLSLGGDFITTTVYSTDNGNNWKSPEEPPVGSSIGCYLSLPGGEILAGGYFHDESSGGMFISNDKGVTWERILGFRNDLFSSVKSFVVSSSNTVYAPINFYIPGGDSIISTIFRLSDQGHSWSEIAKLDTLKISELLINSRDDFVINTYQGSAFVSKDVAQTWELINPGFQNTLIKDIALDANDNLVMSVYDRNDQRMKIFLLPDSGDVWYSLEGLNSPTISYSVLVSADEYIYLYSIDSEIYKSKGSISSILTSE